MRSVSIRQLDMKQATIPLGFEGENEFTEVRIDCKKTFDQHPNAVPSMIVTDPAGNKYPAVVTRDGDIVVWNITAGDLTTKGSGEIQIEFLIDGTVIGRTDVSRTRIERSIFPEGEAPEPVQNWIDEANQTLADVEEAKQAFPAGGTTGQVLTKKSDEDYDTEWKTPQGGGGGTSNYNDLDNKPSINGVTLSGNKSLSDLSIPSQEDVNAKYTKPQGGIPASDIDPSAIPSPTSIIDDNAGEGDTNKVLSADKVTEITTGLSEAIVPLPTTDDSTANGIDLDVSDEDGNVLLRLQNGHIKTKYFDSETAEAKTTHVTVKTDGTGDYTTLRGAIEYINAQGDCDPVDHPYQIDIYPGTYNVFSEYTQAEIEEADVADYHNGFVGPMISDGMNLVGVGDRKSIILYGELSTSTYNSQTRGNVSTLNTQGNCRLENLTVIAINIRYCVHDDFYYYGKQYSRIVRNCDFIGKNLAHSPSCTWGSGMNGKGENALFENCDFGTDYGNHFDATESTKLIFRNCRGRKMRLAERNRAINHYIVIEDSDFEMISLMRPNDVTSQHIHIVANGCADTYISSNEDDVILTAAITKTLLTNLPVGTMVRRATTIGNGYESTSDPATADGFIVANDDYYSYVQRTGYINTRILEMTGFSLGDYITIDGNNALTTGGTAANAVGVITFISNDYDTIDQGVGFIKMLVGGMK